jgi:hypothetical protein
MKTTVELPDKTFRIAKATAAARGISLKEFFTQAVEEKLASYGDTNGYDEKPWMRSFGVLREHSEELQQVKDMIEAEFERIEEEDLA